MAFAQDLLTRIVNVNFGSGVIVVFVDYNSFSGISQFTAAEGVQFLEQFPVSFVNPQPITDATGYAYKVDPAKGEFMTTVSPALSEDFGAFQGYFVHVFAIDGDLDQSLANAKSGTDLISSAWSTKFKAESPEELPPPMPADPSPPGVIWSINTPAIKSNISLTWKIRNGKHRSDDLPDPPNVMVQLYPVGTAPFDGYFIEVYRLDRAGTGTAYGTLYPDTLGTIPPGQRRIDPIWNQNIGSEGDLGIPLQDPPPLISSDVS